MPSQTPNLDQPAEPTDSTEARMRLALGLGTRPSSAAHSAAPSGGSGPPSHDPTRQRRRFAQDGEVPVVMLHRTRESDAGSETKVAALTADLREERAARLKSERALEEANLLIQSLRTKLKHTEMACEEKLRDEREARAQADALLLAEREARALAETRAAEAALALSVLERAAPPAAPRPRPDLFEDVAEPSATALPKRRGPAKAKAKPAAPTPSLPLEPAEAEDEEQPIEWWLPSFRAARKAPARKKRAAG
jgi:hypothetical protein